jgi:hypothetical protein
VGLRDDALTAYGIEEQQSQQRRDYSDGIRKQQEDEKRAAWMEMALRSPLCVVWFPNLKWKLLERMGDIKGNATAIIQCEEVLDDDDGPAIFQVTRTTYADHDPAHWIIKWVREADRQTGSGLNRWHILGVLTSPADLGRAIRDRERRRDSVEVSES